MWSTRIYVTIVVATIVACAATLSILRAMFIVLPGSYGGPLSQIFNITQHARLDEDVYDHPLNPHPVLRNPVFDFLYMNMNDHIEHHMFPLVPFYALLKLHELIETRCPKPHPSLRYADAEIVPFIWQRRDLSRAPWPPLRLTDRTYEPLPL